MNACRFIRIIFFLIVFLESDTSGQDSKWTLLFSAPIKADLMNVDNMGNIYLISGSIVTKYDHNGRLIITYRDARAGIISMIDLNDPLKPLVFFPDFQLIQKLDNQLAYQSGINLRTSAIFQASLVCQSNIQNYWIYDLGDDQLKRIDDRAVVNASSGYLTQILGYKLQPNYMVEFEERLYVNDPQHGILVFDRFGSYYKTIPIKGLYDFQLVQQELIYVKNDEVHSFNLKTLLDKFYHLPSVKGLKAARIATNRLFLSTTDSLLLYSF
ncbi:MAG: hypothetical protein RIQ89_542 [Bacteroidota bacterium]|jgi:hypothetical protein